MPNLQELHDKGLKTCIGKRARPLKSGCREKYRTVFAHTKKSPYPIKYAKTLDWYAPATSPRGAISGGSGGGGSGGGREEGVVPDGGGASVAVACVQRVGDVVGGELGESVMRLGLNLNSHN